MPDGRQRIWVVSPVYFDAGSWGRLRRDVRDVLDQLDPRPELRFIVVDDSAGLDSAMDDLDQLPDTRVITPPFNLGHQRALVYALRSLTDRLGDDDIIVTMDADGEDRPQDLPRLLAPVLGPQQHVRRIALARRTQREESLAFRIFYRIFKILFRTLTGVRLASGNYAAYRGRLLKAIIFHPYFNLAYSSTLVSLELESAYVDCPRGQRYEGESKMGWRRLLLHGVRLLMPFVDRVSIRALLVFTAVFSSAVVGSIAVLAIRLLTDLAIPGWATQSLLVLMSLSVVALGNFVVLFAVFSQSQGVSLSNLEERS